MKADQMQARSRHQSGQALHEFQRRHPEVRGSVAPGALQLQHDVARRIFLEPLVGNRGAGDVAAQAFERLALMRGAAHPGMQAEADYIEALYNRTRWHSHFGGIIPDEFESSIASRRKGVH